MQRNTRGLIGMVWREWACKVDKGNTDTSKVFEAREGKVRS